jgi:hypothetical protein
MKIYDVEEDRWQYLVDRGVSCSGPLRELKLEIRIWNFIAKIINKFKKS